MGSWSIEYIEGSTYVNITGAYLINQSEELDGHEELLIGIPNESGNRVFVANDKYVRTMFSNYLMFYGKLAAPKLKEGVIEAICYNPTIEKLRDKFIHNNYSNTSARTILVDICSNAGVTAGSCPDTLVSVKFKKTMCYDAANFLRESLAVDMWTSGEVVTLGTRGSSLGLISGAIYPSSRGVDRQKVRNHAIVRGRDDNGNDLYGEAWISNDVVVTGAPPSDYLNKTIPFTETRATDQAT